MTSLLSLLHKILEFARRICVMHILLDQKKMVVVRVVYSEEAARTISL
jgi:hypothetical protein